MGSQGSIYNVLGVVTDATEVDPHKLFTINGKTVATGEEYYDKTDFDHGIIARDIKDIIADQRAKLDIRILGFTESRGSRHFKGKALVGYAIAGEYYWGSATELPSNETIDALRQQLVTEIKAQLDLDVTAEQIGVHLLYDFDNSDNRPDNPSKDYMSKEDLKAFRGF